MADQLPTGAGARSSLYLQPLLVAAIVVLVVLGLILPFVTSTAAGKATPPHHGARLSARSAVADALSATIGKGSADMTMSGSFTAGSTHVAFTASGELSMATHAVDLHEKSTASGQALTEQVIVADGVLYAAFPGVGDLVPGKSWVSEDLASLHTGATAWTEGLGMTSDPMNILQLLEKSGGTLHSLGPSTQDGTAVQGYEVTLDGADISSAIASSNLPSWLRQAVSSVDLSSMEVTAYVDSAGLLQSATITIAASVASTAVSVRDHVELTTYGAPVTVHAPTSGLVVTVGQFLKAASQQGS